MGMLATWERAFQGTPITPLLLREMELWEIGVQFGGDIEGPGPLMTFDGEPLDPGAPAPTGPRLSEVD